MRHKNYMLKTYVFTHGSKTHKLSAWNYNEALAELISVVGSEAEAALWIFQGEE